MKQYPNKKEFKNILLNNSLDETTNQYVFEGTPIIFKDNLAEYNLIIDTVSENLQISNLNDNFFVVGSAKYGFSLNPRKKFNDFNDDSDIDLVIINDLLFDKIWFNSLDWFKFQTKGNKKLHPKQWAWFIRYSKNIFQGWVIPDNMIYHSEYYGVLDIPFHLSNDLLPISQKWFFTFANLALIPMLSKRSVKGRLYRTKEHVYKYHYYGLEEIKNALINQEV